MEEATHLDSRGRYYASRSPYGMGHTRRDRILELASGTGQRILDVGCSGGALGHRLRGSGNWVGGVELSREACIEAEKRLDRVWSFDVSDQWPAELQKADLDLVILAEILEHVFDPVRVLAYACQSLRPGGAVVITTPNFLTWTNRLRFLIGDFAYAAEGMFDFGHIRWFTYPYLRSTLAATGFAVTHERHIIFPGRLSPLLRYWPSVFAGQFVVKARKT